MKENDKKTNRIFVKTFNKYLDELTTEEWEIAANMSCGLEVSDDPKPNC